MIEKSKTAPGEDKRGIILESADKLIDTIARDIFANPKKYESKPIVLVGIETNIAYCQSSLLGKLHQRGIRGLEILTSDKPIESGICFDVDEFYQNYTASNPQIE
jgi:hypothetical protein